MAMTPEAKVKKQVKAILDGLDVYHFSPMQNGMGRAGIPDIIACHGGRFIGIECKAGNNKPTALQERELNRILNAGGEAYVIYEENIEQLREELIWMNKHSKDDLL
jgi:Holliday junction resolvase